MERNVNYILVGIFVASALLSLFVFTIWLAGTHDTREYSRYTVHFDSAVGGLEEGSVVKYRGVSVGRIIGIRLAQDRPDLIKVDIEIEKSTPVREQTRGALKPQGITGLSFIELKTEGSDQGKPKKIEGERYPVIMAEPSQLDKIFEDAPELTGNLIALSARLTSIATKVDTLMNEENMEKISGSIVNTYDTSENIKLATANLSKILNDENTAAISTILTNVEGSSGKIDGVVTRADKISQNLEILSNSLVGNKEGLEKFSGEGLDELTFLIRDARGMVTAIKDLAGTLNEEPSRIIFQPNYDGVKIEK